MPGDWEEVVALVAFEFHTQPSELWAMDLDELKFWIDRWEWISEKRRGR